MAYESSDKFFKHFNLICPFKHQYYQSFLSFHYYSELIPTFYQKYKFDSYKSD